jgi:hypothetical protein
MPKYWQPLFRFHRLPGDGRLLIQIVDNLLTTSYVLRLEPVPRPTWDAEADRYFIRGVVISSHRCGGCPGEVVVQHFSERVVFG